MPEAVDEEQPNTFWGRIRQGFSINENNVINPEIAHLPVVVFCGSLVGMMVGGRYGVRIRGATSISNNQLTVYKNSVQAERAYFSAILLGFFQYGSRWGWRAGLYSGIYSTTLTGMSIGRNKEDALSYIVSGAVTGTVYKIFSGFRGIIVGGALGAAICIPVGICMQCLAYFIPYQQILKEDIARQKAERKQHLKLTENVLNRMKNELEDFVNSED